jgi:hypothetical protein
MIGTCIVRRIPQVAYLFAIVWQLGANHQCFVSERDVVNRGTRIAPSNYAALDYGRSAPPGKQGAMVHRGQDPTVFVYLTHQP